jgi:hypothetical protein
LKKPLIIFSSRIRRFLHDALRLMPYALILSSCSLIQPPLTVPSYIRVQSCLVSDTPSRQGTASNHITDIWVDDNSDFRGIYQIPASVPILQTGPTNISLQAMVEENGISSNLLPYPFYTTYLAKNVNLQPGKLDTINPVFYYSAFTNFKWIEGFEGINPLKTTTQNTAKTFITNIKDSVFEGQGSYEVDMTAGQTFYAGTPTPFYPPTSYVVWLEMNYKTDVPMDVGLNFIDPTGNNPLQPEFVSGVNPTSKWKKVYIDLGPELQFFNQYPVFQIYFQANASANAHIFIDNLKLLYFE